LAKFLFLEKPRHEYLHFEQLTNMATSNEKKEIDQIKKKVEIECMGLT
jgi:hypothetical protein